MKPRNRRLAPQDRERAFRALKLRREGMEYRQIAAELGVSTGRAQYIVQQGWDVELRMRAAPRLGILYRRAALGGAA